jgi:hypothetical protein
MPNLTKRGARGVTQDLDRLANLIDSQHTVLGLPEKVASKFAFFCDFVSDRIEKHAHKLASESEEESSEEEEEPKKEESKTAARRKAAKPTKKATVQKRSEDETGLSVDHGSAGFDANVIGDEVGGPLEVTPPKESWGVEDFFSQNYFQELRKLTEAGAIPTAVSNGAILVKTAESLARLKRLASFSNLSSMEDVLKVLHARLAVSTMAEVKALAPDVKKQIDAVGKVRDVVLQQQAVGAVDAVALGACEQIMRAVGEQIPYLQQVVSGVDSGSPIALLEFQKMVGGSSLKELIALGTSIVVAEASKLKGGEEKEASLHVAEEKEEKKEEKGGLPPWLQKGDKGEKKEDKKASEEETEEDEEETEEEESEGSDKEASFGYDLFA